MNPMDFDFIAKLLKERSGLDLSKDKTYLLESRLGPVAREHDMVDISELIMTLKMRPKEDLIKQVTEAMTTNESFFFRDKTPFDLFRKTMLPNFVNNPRPTRKIRIWCAAASSGQEPYSLAITLKEMEKELSGWRFEILATDISDDVLDKARAARYSQFEVQRGLPIQMLVKYFNKAGDGWEVKPEIKQMVNFKNFNLLDSFAGMGKFDIVFCRNVLIYFDRPTKAEILNRMHDLVARDGFLVLGAAETVFGLTDSFSGAEGHRGLYLPRGFTGAELAKSA